MYSQCLENLSHLQEIEIQPEYMTYLKNLEVSASWQKGRFQQVLDFESDQKRFEVAQSFSIEENNVTEEPQQISTPSSSTFKKRKCTDDKAEVRRNIIESSLVSPGGGGLGSIAGLDKVKMLLKKSILLPITYPKLYTGGRKPWCHILLFGPPGTGKTKLARALATETKANFYAISSADLLSSWFGESEKMMKDLFEIVRKNTERSIIFIDEIDSICRKRTDREGEAVRSMKNQLFIELDKNVQAERSNYVICATNCPWELDLAFLRRFQLRLYIPLPDREGRRKLVEDLCKGVRVKMSPEDWQTVAERTEGYSGSDLVTVTSAALHAPLDDLINNTMWTISKDNEWIPCTKNTGDRIEMDITQIPPDKIAVREVSMKDFSKAILLTPKTIPKAEIDKYQKYISQQGL